MNIDGPVIIYAGVENQKLRKINDDRVVSEQVNQGFSLYWDTAKDPKLCDRVENDHSVGMSPSFTSEFHMTICRLLKLYTSLVANKVGDSAVQRLVIAVKETCTSVATKAAISNNEANGTGNQVIAVTNTELANLNDILASPWKCVIL